MFSDKCISSYTGIGAGVVKSFCCGAFTIMYLTHSIPSITPMMNITAENTSSDATREVISMVELDLEISEK